MSVWIGGCRDLLPATKSQAWARLAGVALRTWGGIKNGELLARAAARFDVFVTVDQNLSFQQNLSEAHIAVIVLRAKTSRLDDLVRLVPRLMAALDSVTP